MSKKAWNMLKLVLKSSLVVIFSVSLFINFYLLFVFENYENKIKSKTPVLDELSKFDDFDYLNEIRTQHGLRAFRQNSNLQTSAQNHANYLLANSVISHEEISNQKEFYETTPNKRAIKAGYHSYFVFEGFSKNQINAKKSIDDLLSAIYHRFIFLNYELDEIGAGYAFDKKSNIYVYNLGNIKLNLACMQGGDEISSGFYLEQICKDQNAKIKKENFDSFVQNIDYIAFPKNLSSKAYFSNEVPNPLPECKIASNPASIEFGSKFSDIHMLDFELFSNGKKLDDTIILTRLNDTNLKFTDKQFAVFSRSVFDFAQEYKAVFSYLYNGEKKQISWKWTTKTPEIEYFSAKNGDVLEFEPDKEYDIFFVPKDCNDAFESFSYQNNMLTNVKINKIDTNLIRLKFSGFNGSSVKIKTDTGAEVTAVLSKDSKNFGDFRLRIIIICVVSFVLLIFVLFYKRKKR